MNISDKERKIVLEFLQWNDKNGCFTDENCKQENLKPFGKRDVLKFFFFVVNSDFFKGKDTDNPLAFSLSEIIQIAKDTNVYFSTIKKLEMLIENNSVSTYEKIIKLIK